MMHAWLSIGLGWLVAAAPPPVFTDFTAWYSLHSFGLRAGEAVRKLERKCDNTYQLTTTSRATGLAALIRDLRIEESSRWQWRDDQVRPLRYEYSHQSEDKKRLDRIEFDWSRQQARVVFKKKEAVLPVEPGTQDLLSAQMTLLLALRAGPPTDIEVPVVDRGKHKVMRLRYRGEEAVETPLGSLNAYRFERLDEDTPERITRFWFAPKLRFLLVAGEHEEPNGTSVRMRLERVEGITPANGPDASSRSAPTQPPPMPPAPPK